jgi:hypothetical protein
MIYYLVSELLTVLDEESRFDSNINNRILQVQYERLERQRSKEMDSEITAF